MDIGKFNNPELAKKSRKENNKNKKSNEEDKISRRKFLKVSAASAGAFGVGFGAGSLINKGIEKAKEYFGSEEEGTILEKERELSESEKVAKEILDTFNLPALQRRIDREVFTKDFYMAQQFQESRGEANVESNKHLESKERAKGVYQNKPDSVVEVVEYLDFLREETVDKPVDERVDYLGPASVTEDEADEISEYFKVVADYGRATGKLYLQAMHDPEYKYCDGKPNKDVFRGESVKDQQIRLLIGYHDGPAQRVNPAGASQNGKDYVKYVFKHMETIDDLRGRLEKTGMPRDSDYAILKIMRELERGENKDTKKNPNAREQAINFWMKRLQDEHMIKWQYPGKYGEELNNEEIRKIFPEDKKQ